MPVRVDSEETVFYFPFALRPLRFSSHSPGDAQLQHHTAPTLQELHSPWRSNDPTQRFSGALIKRTQPVFTPAHLSSPLLHPHDAGLSHGAAPGAPSPAELLMLLPLLAASALATLTPDYCSSAGGLVKDELLKRKLMMLHSRSASTGLPVFLHPKVRLGPGRLASDADSPL